MYMMLIVGDNGEPIAIPSLVKLIIALEVMSALNTYLKV
jgi:hypothetical protein